MKKNLCFLCLSFLFIACQSSKPTVITTKKQADKVGYTPKPPSPVVTPLEDASPAMPALETPAEISPKAQNIIETALSYSGTPYAYRGTTVNGMDCSGLVYTSFAENDITLERSSHLMATRGKRIDLSQVRPGDLVFFITSRDKSRINHVGLVIKNKDNDIRFIHATTSKGVLISSMKENYWDHAFVQARNIL